LSDNILKGIIKVLNRCVKKPVVADSDVNFAAVAGEHDQPDMEQQ
jgi:hypothetical protein